MDQTPLYQEIVDAVRQQIISGILKPDDELPTVRAMSEQWGCAPGTVQRAYKELAALSLVTARIGAGTRVASFTADQLPAAVSRAVLINQAENFLLNALSGGHETADIEAAFYAALDRWRALPAQSPQTGAQALRFVGSHDPAFSIVCAHLQEPRPSIAYAGSLRGLMALSRREADIAGSHLWDAETGTYNAPFIRRLLPGRRVALLRVADRSLGLIVAPDNPLDLSEIADLARKDVVFVNRQEGAGTRVWLDARLRQLRIEADTITGYDSEAQTHSELAALIAEGQADVGLGIEAASVAYGLSFVPLTTEAFDLVIPDEHWATATVQTLVNLLADQDMQASVRLLEGYDTAHSGQVRWIEASP